MPRQGQVPPYSQMPKQLTQPEAGGSACLRHGDNVWDNALVLEAPVGGPCPPEACLHLIRYAHAPRLSHHLRSARSSLLCGSIL